MKKLVAVAVMFFVMMLGSGADARVVYPYENRAGKIAGGSWDTLSTAEITRNATMNISGREWIGRIANFSSIEISDERKMYGSPILDRDTSQDGWLNQHNEFTAVFVDSCKGAYIFAILEDSVSWEIGEHIATLFPDVRRTVRKQWGESGFDLDGQDQVLILVYPFAVDINFRGFVSTRDQLPLWSPNNGIEAIHVNSRLLATDYMSWEEFLAHEYQHIIALSWDYYEDQWMLEGMAMLAQYLATGNNLTDFYDFHSMAPFYYVEFKSWEYSSFDYWSAGMLFVWLERVYGMDTIISIMRDPHNGEDSIARAVGKPWNEIWSQYRLYFRADFSGNTVFDDEDLKFFVFDGLRTQYYIYDLNDDGQVDTADLYLFAQQMGISEQAVAKLVAEYTSEPQVVGIQNYPNPFNAHTTIQFMVRERGWVKVQIFNALGQLVTKLHDGEVGAGLFQKKWDGSDVSSGLYIVRAEVSGEVMKSQMTLVK